MKTECSGHSGSPDSWERAGNGFLAGISSRNRFFSYTLFMEGNVI